MAYYMNKRAYPFFEGLPCESRFICEKDNAMNARTASSAQSERVAPRVSETDIWCRRICLALVAIAGFPSFLLVSAPALAQVAPSLASEAPFAIVSSTYTNTVAGTTINGNVCFTTGPAVAPVVVGTVGPCPGAAVGDQNAATATLTGQACTTIAGPLEGVIIGANPPGTFPPGCYTSVGALGITANGIVTLNGNGVFVFRSTGGAITTGANSNIVLAGGACAGNVFWTAVGATTLGGASTFVGSILDAAGVTFGLGANLSGRALASGGTVTTNGANTISVPAACAAIATTGAVPTLSEWAMVMLAALLAIVGFAAMRRYSR
jgi:hypothetical protein